MKTEYRMKKINVLVTSVGGIVAQGIIKSLKYHNKYSKNKTYHYNIYRNRYNIMILQGYTESINFQLLKSQKKRNISNQ